MSDQIRIALAHYPVTVLGPGRRVGIWLQGCSAGCPGCIAKDTWAVDGGSNMPVAQLVAWCRQFEPQGVDGITISGGEPFEQPEALEALLRGLHAWTDGLEIPADYLCYTGKSLEHVQECYPDILKMLDTIIPEPFLVELPGRPLRGSANQPVIHLTGLGTTRFARGIDEPSAAPGKQMQFVMEGNAVRFIGIPARGDLERLVAQCRAKGLLIENVSWD